MSFFTRLFGSTDPTSDWPAATGQAPQVSFDRQVIESLGARLPFGAALDAARVFGKPDTFSSAAPGVFTLTYARWGVVLEFEQSRFVQVSFVIDPAADAGSGDLSPADVRGRDAQRLLPSTTHDEVVERFGEPSRQQTFDEETILYYTGDALSSEFQLENGRLIRWDVYLD